MTTQLTEHTKLDTVTTALPILDYDAEFDLQTCSYPTKGEVRYRGIV